MYTRAFSRLVGFRILMQKDDPGSGAPTTQKGKLEAAEAALTKANDEKAAAEKKLEEALTAKTEWENLKGNLEQEKTKLQEDLNAAVKAKEEALKERDTAAQAKADAEKAKTKAEEDLKTADERAEQKLRELDAKNGGTLPPKKPGANDHTQKPATEDANKTPTQRLAATIKIAGESGN